MWNCVNTFKQKHRIDKTFQINVMTHDFNFVVVTKLSVQTVNFFLYIFADYNRFFFFKLAYVGFSTVSCKKETEKVCLSSN